MGKTRGMFGGIPTDREVWVELHDRSVRAHLSHWHQVQRGPFDSEVGWVGRVQYPRPVDGGQFDGLTPEQLIRPAWPSFRRLDGSI